MDLRSNPGTVLDRVDYLNESFIIERAGKAKAALVPMSIYKLIERSREQLIADNAYIRNAFKNDEPQKIERQIKKAIKEVRARK